MCSKAVAIIIANPGKPKYTPQKQLFLKRLKKGPFWPPRGVPGGVPKQAILGPPQGPIWGPLPQISAKLGFLCLLITGRYKSEPICLLIKIPAPATGLILTPQNDPFFGHFGVPNQPRGPFLPEPQKGLFWARDNSGVPLYLSQGQFIPAEPNSMGV